MGYLISRRALLAASVSGAALLALPRATWSAEPAKGGRLVVAADSEPPNLNPAMVASNGVFFVASKVIEPLVDEAVLLGAGMVAATGAGFYPDLASACIGMHQGGRERQPNPVARARFDRDYRIFLEMHRQRRILDSMG